MSDQNKNPPWQPPPAKIIIPSENEIHVWRTQLDFSSAQIEQLWQLLSIEEQKRGLRYKFAQHKRRFTAAKGMLRLILSQYLNQAPEQINFTYNAHGKPQLDQGSKLSLEFNTSDSNEIALFAISATEPVGVDLEFIHKEIDAEAIARRFFSDYEVRELLELPNEQRNAAFFNIWTRKEAFIKALGLGLSFPLKGFDVSLEKQAALLSVRQGGHIAAEWSLFALEPAEDYAGALAVRGKNKTLKLWDFKTNDD